MRVSVAVNAAMVAAAPPAQESRFVVLGTDGRVVPNADPTLFLTKTRLPTVFLDHVHELQVFSPALKDSSPDEFTHIQVDGEAIAVAVQTVDESSLSEDDDEFAGPIDVHLDVLPLEPPQTFLLEDNVPAVQGSIIFAELSCVFVAFIGYLVATIGLWSSFSRGQKGCLAVVFSSAGLYQGAAFAWYVGALSADAMLGLSSLITRMISLGMVPITTTSFMGRARELCHEQQITTSSGGRGSSRRHRHPRARSS